MAGNSFGTVFRVLTFGESHGPGAGCVVDGCPAGLALDVDAIRRELRRRRPGSGPASTTRIEADEPEILSGLFEGRTLGTPIAILVRNASQRSSDYDALRDVYRPGHADWTWEAKYGFRDHRGGGRSSGRETLGRVAAGAIAKVFLAAQGITIRAWASSIAGIEVPGPETPGFDPAEAERNPLCIPRRDYVDKILEELDQIRAAGDSAGGVVSCTVENLPPGLGEPVFDKLDARLAAAMMSLGAVKGIEFGAGFAAAHGRGSDQNDGPIADDCNAGAVPAVEKPAGQAAFPPALGRQTNKAGGILGGISTGLPLEFNVACKPPPSIAKPQMALARNGGVQAISIGGRHDICIVPRAVPVVEAMTALVLADLLLLRRLDR